MGFKQNQMFVTPSVRENEDGLFVETRRISNAGWAHVPVGGLVVDYGGDLLLRTCDAGYELIIGNVEGADRKTARPKGDAIAVDLSPADMHGKGEGTLLAVLPQDTWSPEMIAANEPQIGDFHSWDALCETCLYVSRNATGRVDGVACARAGWVANQDGWYYDPEDVEFVRSIGGDGSRSVYAIVEQTADCSRYAEVIASTDGPFLDVDACRDAFNKWALEQPADSIMPALRP